MINRDNNTYGLTSGVSCARWQAFGYHELITEIAELPPLDRFEILQELDGLPDSDPYLRTADGVEAESDLVADWLKSAKKLLGE